MFRKDFNLKIFSLLIAVIFFLSNTAYAIDSSGKSHLRLPSSARYNPKRLNDGLTAMLNMEGLDERQHGLLNRALASFFVGFNKVRDDIHILRKTELARIDPKDELAEVKDLKAYRFTREQIIEALRKIGANERDIAYITANLISHPGRFRDEEGNPQATNLFILDEYYTALAQLDIELRAQWARHEMADLENLALPIEQQRTEKQIQDDYPLNEVVTALQNAAAQSKTDERTWQRVDGMKEELGRLEAALASEIPEDSDETWLDSPVITDAERDQMMKSVGGVQRDRIPQDHVNALDFNGLGYFYKDPPSMVLSYRPEARPFIRWQLQHPILDSQEIVSRQDAIKEIMTSPKEALFISLLEWLKKDPAGDVSRFDRTWAIDLFQDEFMRGKFIKAMDNKDGEWGMPKWGFGYKTPNREVVEKIKGNFEEFLNSMSDLYDLLKDVQSPRLKALRWVVQSSVDPNHPYGLYNLFNDFKDETIIEALTERHEELNLLYRAVREINTYVYISQWALGGGRYFYDPTSREASENVISESAWNTFPRILPYDEKNGALLKIKEGHGPRQLDGGYSVPNSVSLGKKLGQNVQITSGPNMEGKTTFVRMVAQLATLGMLGAPVPAGSMEMTPLRVRALFKNMLGDDPENSLSGFRNETEATLRMVKAVGAQPDTILCMDEVLTGTIPRITAAALIPMVGEMINTGGLFIVSTHNEETVGYFAENEVPGVIVNHVGKYRLYEGPAEYEDMVVSAASVLEESGWDSRGLEEFHSLAELFRESGSREREQRVEVVNLSDLEETTVFFIGEELRKEKNYERFKKALSPEYLGTRNRPIVLVEREDEIDAMTMFLYVDLGINTDHFEVATFEDVGLDPKKINQYLHDIVGIDNFQCIPLTDPLCGTYEDLRNARDKVTKG